MFSYDVAFSRNLGWTTEWEQAALRAKRVAVAGMGGVGGSHLLALTRLGIGGFSIADFDTFDIVNLNRQAGANAASMGRPKVDVMAEQALAINPELRLTRFGEGVTPDNIDRFLDGCDLFVDGLDFFVLDIRARLFARCSERGIPAVTAAPIGLGTGFLAFLPGGQSFEQYFRIAGQPQQEQYLRFLMGVAPRGLHRAYLADDTRVDLAARRGPSTVAACELCAGVVATQALKILLGRGKVPAAPLHLTMDAYLGRAVRTRLRWGNAGPLQRLKLAVARRVYGAMAARSPAPAPTPLPTAPVYAILDAGRWAPSGDNVQPWRFEILDAAAARVRIHLDGGTGANPYEYRGGEPILLAGGMLLESLRVAASAQSRGLEWTLRPQQAPRRWSLDAQFPPVPGLAPSPLLAALPMRSVERRPLGRTRLTAAAKLALVEALGPGLAVTWHEAAHERATLARLGAMATAIRLRAPETFAVHRGVIDWDNARSPAGLPARAIGLDRATLAVMRWGMVSWQRMQRLNALLGTGGAALQLDLLPGLRSAAFFSVRALPHGNASDPAVAALCHGERLQRFWLVATRLGLGLQPALATLIFADHGAHGTPFSAVPGLQERAGRLAAAATAALGPVAALRFLGRIGTRPHGMPRSRSVRRPLSDLLVGSGQGGAADDVRGPQRAFAGDEVPHDRLLPENPVEHGADRAHGRLPLAVELDDRSDRLEVDRGRLQQADQAALHDGAPMGEAGLAADGDDALHQAQPHQRSGGGADAGTLAGERKA
jgi:molybdopterin/thiamine biosynthesis adenylyltransferase/nitroreductase